MAKPQTYGGHNYGAGRDVHGDINYQPGSHPTYLPGSYHVAGDRYDIGDISGRPNIGGQWSTGGHLNFGEGSISGGGGGGSNQAG